MSGDIRFILGDTETTGPTTSDKVVEIAWVELDANLNVIDRVHSLIDPERPISAGASGVHGLTAEDVADAPTIEEFWDLVLPEHMGRPRKLDGDVVFIAHNSQFDMRYFGPKMPGLVAQMCTLRLARRWFPNAENHKLQTLKFELNLRRGTSHRADGDVDMTLHLLELIVAESGKDLMTLAEESMEPEFVQIMPFGKHKLQDIRQVPTSYMDWLQKPGGAGVDRDLAYTFDIIRAERKATGSRM